MAAPLMLARVPPLGLRWASSGPPLGLLRKSERGDVFGGELRASTPALKQGRPHLSEPSSTLVHSALNMNCQDIKLKKWLIVKFRFCGDGDCPDWVLAEIIATLSVLSVDKLQELAALVATRIIGHKDEKDLAKQLAGSAVAGDGKSAVACMHYLLVNAARHNVSECVFDEEIQQLGLPKEHAAAVCRVLTANEAAIRQRLIDKSFKINELAHVQHIPNADESLGYAKFQLNISQELVDGLPENTAHTVHMDRVLVKSLLADLKSLDAIAEQFRHHNMQDA